MFIYGTGLPSLSHQHINFQIKFLLLHKLLFPECFHHYASSSYANLKQEKICKFCCSLRTGIYIKKNIYFLTFLTFFEQIIHIFVSFTKANEFCPLKQPLFLVITCFMITMIRHIQFDLNFDLILVKENHSYKRLDTNCRNRSIGPE